jgi:ribonuclease VapC
MFADASALTAILVGEDDALDLAERMARHARRITSPLATWETTVAVARIRGVNAADASAAVERYLTLAAVEVVDVPAAARFVALDAFARFGKGRHPAALNFGDCFAYACAKLAAAPMLYKGDGFALIDIERA